MLIALAETDQLDDVGMVRPSHDLDFLENVGALGKRRSHDQKLCHGMRGARA